MSAGSATSDERQTPNREEYLAAARRVATFLREDQLPSGTIYDRQEGAATRDDHYGHSHFALLTAQLFRMTGDESWLEPMRRAMLYCVDLWEQHPERGGHRDFNDVAVAEAYALVSDILPEDERARWEGYLRDCTRPGFLGRGNHHTIIYHTFYRLGQIFEREDDCQWAQQCMNDRILPAFAPDRFWCDNVGPERLFENAYWPMAYHPFNLVYLHRYILASGDRKAREVFLEALEASAGLVAPDGDYNVLGRDQESNVSYTSLVYAYEAGAAEVAGEDSEKAERYREVAARAWDWLQQYLCEDGFFRIKPNELDPLRGGYDVYENNVVYGALSAIHLMWAAEVCRGDVSRHGRIPADDEVCTWLPDSGFLLARSADLATLIGRGAYFPNRADQRSVGMVPGFLKVVRGGQAADLLPTPGGGTSEVHLNPRAHPRTGLLPYFIDELGRIGHLWEADGAFEREEMAEGIRLFGEGRVLWGCDRDMKLRLCETGIRQRRIAVLHKEAGLLVFDEFVGRDHDRGIHWVPYNISFFGEPWRNDTRCDHAASARDGLRVVYAVPEQPVPLSRVDCSPYLSSKGPAYHFGVQPQIYSPCMLASRVAVEEGVGPVRAAVATVQVTQDRALAVHLPDRDLTVAVNFAEKDQLVRAADTSWEVEVRARSVRSLGPRTFNHGSP